MAPASSTQVCLDSNSNIRDSAAADLPRCRWERPAAASKGKAASPSTAPRGTPVVAVPGMLQPDGAHCHQISHAQVPTGCQNTCTVCYSARLESSSPACIGCWLPLVALSRAELAWMQPAAAVKTELICHLILRQCLDRVQHNCGSGTGAQYSAASAHQARRRVLPSECPQPPCG